MKGQHIQYKETPGRYFQRVTGKEVSAQEAGGAFDVVGGTAPSHLLTGGPRPTGSRVVQDTGQPSGQFRLPVGGGAVAGAYQDYLTAQGPTDTRTPEQIRGAYTQQYQQFIDSINLQYSEMIRGAQAAGEQRLGTVSGAAAASGRIGSTSFAAHRAGVQEETRGVVGAIEAQRSAKISSIFQRIDENVERKLEQQRQAAITKAETRIQVLTQMSDETKEDLAGLAAQGVTYDQLNEQDATEIQDLLGWGEGQMKVFMNANLPMEERSEYVFMNVGSGNVAVFDKTKGGEPDVYNFGTNENELVREIDGILYKCDTNLGTCRKFEGIEAQPVSGVAPTTGVVSPEGVSIEEEPAPYLNTLARNYLSASPEEQDRFLPKSTKDQIAFWNEIDWLQAQAGIGGKADVEAKSEFQNDKNAGMPLEDAIRLYGADFGEAWIRREYGEQPFTPTSELPGVPEKKKGLLEKIFKPTKRGFGLKLGE